MADEWANSDQMRKIHFGKMADRYEYVPCIRTFSQNFSTFDYVEMKLNVVPNGSE
jgi:hypothetical protein